MALRLPGTDAGAESINNRGQIVGFAKAADGDVHAVLWQDGKPRDLGTLGGTSSYANGINDRGLIVGWSTIKARDASNHEIRHAFVWENGRMRDLGTLTGSRRESDALAINNNGEIVGTASNIDGGGSRAWIWRGGTMRSLGVNAAASGATAINDHGQVVGWSERASGKVFVFLSEKGRTRILNVPTNYGGAVINDRGQIVPGQGEVVWQEGRSARLCAPRPGASDCWVYALNNRGQIVGSYGDDAALWENGKRLTLSTPWAIQDSSIASGINDHSEIVGEADSSPMNNGEDTTTSAWVWARRK